jgi:gamma-glutamylcyclotransferase (GGCT)/AIG2-like uncharacterized protein YtfP
MGRKQFLFAYGTLRKDYPRRGMERLEVKMEFIGRARTGGRMVDLGKYPGAIPDQQGREIIGDLFFLAEAKGTLELLDLYEAIDPNFPEDSEFVRKQSKVRLDSGTVIDAWIYWYHGEPGKGKAIRHKDYLNYLKNKRTR